MPADLAHDDTRTGAPTVLFAHAFPFDRRLFRRQVDAVVARGARAVAPDLRGFGASSGLAKATTIDEHADDLARLLDRAGVERAILVGLSLGGYVALAFARRHPARLAGLLLSDTKAGPDSAEAKAGRAVNMERARREGAAAVFEAMAPKLLPRDAPPAVLDELRAFAAAQAPEGVVAALEAMRDRPDATPTLSSIRVPTRVVVGSEDQATPPAEAEILARGIPGATLTVIADVGHFPNVERPERFDEVLLDLVAEVSRP